MVAARLEEVPDRKMRIINMAAAGDAVFTEAFWEGTSSGEQAALGPKGTPVSRRCVVVWRFVDGRIVNDWTYN